MIAMKSIYFGQIVHPYLVSINLLPALAVGQCDALRCHLELDYGGSGAWVAPQRSICCLGDGLGAGQRLCFHRVQVEDVTG